MATFSRQMLSRHKTTATYEGQEEGRESMLKVRQNFNELKRAPWPLTRRVDVAFAQVFPPRPNKMWETFHIIAYESYEKPGQYGDAQQTVQRFTDLEGDHAATVAKLNKGDKVKLEWDHNYVTRTENGGESKYPERVITLLEPIP